MSTPSEVTYTTTRSEVVEYADYSLQAEIDGVRQVNFNTKLSLDMVPEKGIIIFKLRILVERPDGKFAVKLIVRLHFKVNMYAKLNGSDEYMGLPEDIYLSMANETWDYARTYLKSRKTPIANAPIPNMPPDIFESNNLPPLSLN